MKGSVYKLVISPIVQYNANPKEEEDGLKNTRGLEPNPQLTLENENLQTI